MFNRRSLFGTLANLCTTYGIERDQLRLDSGGACVYHRLRETTGDIDISINGDVFDAIVEKHGLIPTLLPALGTSPEILMVTIAGVDAHRVESVEDKPSRFHRGFRIQTLEELLKFKVSMGREKDKSDILKLKDHWASLDDEQMRRVEELLS